MVAVSDSAAFKLREEELRALSREGVARAFPKQTVIVSEGDETD